MDIKIFYRLFLHYQTIHTSVIFEKSSRVISLHSQTPHIQNELSSKPFNWLQFIELSLNATIQNYDIIES